MDTAKVEENEHKLSKAVEETLKEKGVEVVREEAKTAQVNMGKEPPFGETTIYEDCLGRHQDEDYKDYKLRLKREHYNFKNRRKNNFLHTSKYVEPAKKDGTKQKVYGDGTKRGSFKDEKETK